jgi:hypothetical protein
MTSTMSAAFLISKILSSGIKTVKKIDLHRNEYDMIDNKEN